MHTPDQKMNVQTRLAADYRLRKPHANSRERLQRGIATRPHVPQTKCARWTRQTTRSSFWAGWVAATRRNLPDNVAPATTNQIRCPQQSSPCKPNDVPTELSHGTAPRRHSRMFCLRRRDCARILSPPAFDIQGVLSPCRNSAFVTVEEPLCWGARHSHRKALQRLRDSPSAQTMAIKADNYCVR